MSHLIEMSTTDYITACKQLLRMLTSCEVNNKQQRAQSGSVRHTDECVYADTCITWMGVRVEFGVVGALLPASVTQR